MFYEKNNEYNKIKQVVNADNKLDKDVKTAVLSLAHKFIYLHDSSPMETLTSTLRNLFQTNLTLMRNLNYYPIFQRPLILLC